MSVGTSNKINHVKLEKKKNRRMMACAWNQKNDKERAWTDPTSNQSQPLIPPTKVKKAKEAKV